jgi:hypothetical protein
MNQKAFKVSFLFELSFGQEELTVLIENSSAMGFVGGFEFIKGMLISIL